MLYGSSGTLEGINSVIRQFYSGQEMRIEGEKVIRCSDEKILDGVKVIKKKGRYRFMKA